MADAFNGEFLKNLPQSLHPKQRVALEGISFSIDAIEIKYLRILSVLSQHRDAVSISSMTSLEKTSVFSDVWSIIDHVHAINQLLYNSQKKQKNDENTDLIIDLEDTDITEVMSKYDQNFSTKIRSLRNQMDHLGGNLNKTISKKAVQPPLFGSLSYLLTNPEELKEGKLDVVVLSSGPHIKKTHDYAAINPCDFAGKPVNSPVDYIELNAFDEILNITELFHSIISIKNLYNTTIAAIFEESFKKYAEDKGISFEDLIKPLAGSFTGVLHMQTAESI